MNTRLPAYHNWQVCLLSMSTDKKIHWNVFDGLGALLLSHLTAPVTHTYVGVSCGKWQANRSKGAWAGKPPWHTSRGALAACRVRLTVIGQGLLALSLGVTAVGHALRWQGGGLRVYCLPPAMALKRPSVPAVPWGVCGCLPYRSRPLPVVTGGGLDGKQAA